jgi:hypothetical protein
VSQPAVVLEIEELLFDTLGMRAEALQSALAAEGVPVPLDELLAAHAGVPAVMALEQLRRAHPLDDVGAALVLRRAADVMSAFLARHSPAFDRSACVTIEVLATEHRIGVVTRATREDAQRLLAQVGLEAVCSVVRSLADLDAHARATVWHDMPRLLRTDHVVAVVPHGLVASASAAALIALRTDQGQCLFTDGRRCAFAALDAEALASLFRRPTPA